MRRPVANVARGTPANRTHSMDHTGKRKKPHRRSRFRYAGFLALAGAVVLMVWRLASMNFMTTISYKDTGKPQIATQQDLAKPSRVRRNNARSSNNNQGAPPIRNSVTRSDVLGTKNLDMKTKMIASQGLFDQGNKPEETSKGSSGSLKTEKKMEQCGIYMAPSTIPNAGIGMFTGIDRRKGDGVGFGDLVVPIFDQMYHSGKVGSTKPFLWDDYCWVADAVGMYMETSSQEEPRAASPGFGASVNCHLGLINVKEGPTQYDVEGLIRHKDVGVGAFSGYHNRSNVASRDVPQGAELFVDYGSKYFESRFDKYGFIPYKYSYKDADDLLEKYNDTLRTPYKHILDKNTKMEQDLWAMISSGPFESRTSNALPTSFEQMELALNVGTANSFLNDTIRSMAWLQQHGRCIDHIRPGRSTIRQAGRGAFTTRFVPKGTAVSSAPLLHIPDESILFIHERIPNLEFRPNNATLLSKQLLTNYCFGHRNSTMLLSPYSYMSLFINHNSVAEKVNAKVRWVAPDDRPLSHNPDWLNYSVKELTTLYESRLMLEYVALRDIQQGEEVFIDYGPEWQAAWDAHVEAWNKIPKDPNYHGAAEWNADERPLPLPNETRSVPDNVQMRCLRLIERSNYLEKLKQKEHFLELEKVSESKSRPCQVLDREINPVTNETFYTVELFIRNTTQTVDQNKTLPVSAKGTIRSAIPRSAIFFLDKPYTSDMHIPTAFRHPIMIPDEMFPDMWKNR